MPHGGQEPARPRPGTQYFSVGDESVPEPASGAGSGAAALHGGHGLRLPLRADTRSSCAADGGHSVGFFRLLDLPVAEQDIEVPKVSSSSAVGRSADGFVLCLPHSVLWRR